VLAAGGINTPEHKGKVRLTTTPHVDGAGGWYVFYANPGRDKSATFDGKIITSGDTVGCGGSLWYCGITGQPVTISVPISQVWDAADDYDFDLPAKDTLGEEQTRTMRLRLAMESPIQKHTIAFRLRAISVEAYEFDIETGIETSHGGTYPVPEDGSAPSNLPFGLTLGDLFSYTGVEETAPGDYTGMQIRRYWSGLATNDEGHVVWREAWTASFEFCMYDTTVYAQEGEQ
jgi:hypothetical protein